MYVPISGLIAFSGINIEDQQKDVKDKKDVSNKVASKRKLDSDSDSDYEYFKVQKELEANKPKIVEEVKEKENNKDERPVKKENVFEEAVKSAVVDDELVLPATVNQKFLIVPMKLRLVTLCSLIVEHCYLDKKCGKMIVFMATTEMVDYHSELLETVLTGKEAKVKKKEDKKTKANKQKTKEKGDEVRNHYFEQIDGSIAFTILFCVIFGVCSFFYERIPRNHREILILNLKWNMRRQKKAGWFRLIWTCSVCTAPCRTSDGWRSSNNSEQLNEDY